MATSTAVDPVARSATTRRRAATVAGATAAAAAVWLGARVAGTDPTVTFSGQPPMAIGLSAVLVTAFATSLAAWVTLAVLERWTRRGRAWWRILACAVLVTSFVPILSARADGGTRLTLAVMHLAVAGVLIPVLPRFVEHQGGRS